MSTTPKRVLKFDSLSTALTATTQKADAAESAAIEALLAAGVDSAYISFDKGVLPDTSIVTPDPNIIGAYFTNDNLFQKVEWDGSAWQDVGKPIPAKEYVDEKESLVGINNVNALKTLTLNKSILKDNDTVNLLGYYEPGDGGGGIFIWDETSTENPDDALIIKADAYETGRWKSLISTLSTIQKDIQVKVSVGSGGDFATLNDAIEFLSLKYRPAYRKDTIFSRDFDTQLYAEIILKSGYVMQEQVLINGLDLSWMFISSEDEEVVVDRASMTERLIISYTPAFGAINSAKLPIINVLFSMNETGTQGNQHGIALFENSDCMVLPNKGFKNAVRNVYVVRNARFSCNDGIFTGGKEFGIRMSNLGFSNIRGCDFSDSDFGISCVAGSVANASRVILNNCNVGADADSNGKLHIAYCEVENCGTGIRARGLGGVYAEDSDIKDCASSCVTAEDGGTIDISESTVTGGGVENIRAFRGGKVVSEKELTATGAGSFNLRAADGGEIIISGTGNNFSGAGNQNVQCSGGNSRVTINNADVTDYEENAIRCTQGGHVYVFNSDCRKDGETENPNDIRIGTGGTIVKSSTQGGIRGTSTTFTPNELTADGYIIEN